MPEARVTNNEKVGQARLNWLRAAVLGVNDGLVSVSSITLGVAGASSNHEAIFTAGLAGLVAGALSMAVGEYISVSSQSDSEKTFINQEKIRLRYHGAEELANLAKAYVEKGLSPKLAKKVAEELTAKDAIAAHLDIANIGEDDISSPSHAAIASLLSFTVGGLVPLLVVSTVSDSWRFGATFVAVSVALIITGYISATIGRASKSRAIIRIIIGGALAMLITYGAGALFGGVVG